MRIVTKTILTAFLIIFSITAAGIYLIYTSAPDTPQPLTPQPPTQNTTHSSFETSMDNWTTNATDLTNPPIHWFITRTTTTAYDGNTSLQLTLDNLNDQGKIWIQHPFTVEPSTHYHVLITYQLGTTDYGMNPFRLITGVTATPPTKNNLTYQDDTSNGLDNNTFQWIPKTYEFITTSSPTGLLYASIGIWGTWETNRTYYLDDITTTTEPIPPATILPDLNGTWTLTTYDHNDNITATTTATITQTQDLVTLTFDNTTTTWLITPNVLAYTPMSTGFILSGTNYQSQQPILYILSNDAITSIQPDSRLQLTRNT